MKSRNFFVELKRRNVYKVAVAYAIVGWLLVQIATQVFPFLEIPNWVVRLVIVLAAVGFPIAQREVVGYLRALLYLSLNNNDQALRWLEKSFEERDGSNISWIKVDPLLEPLHGDPRFEALVQKVVGPR